MIKLNQAVDANPTLKNAKDSTAKGIAMMSSSVSSWFGWGKKPEEVKEVVDQVQEGIPVAYDHIEEAKGDEALD